MSEKEIKSWIVLLFFTIMICIVKIDDVDVNNIMPSLGDYKYYDLSNGNKTELIKDIINAINAQN